MHFVNLLIYRNKIRACEKIVRFSRRPLFPRTELPRLTLCLFGGIHFDFHCYNTPFSSLFGGKTAGPALDKAVDHILNGTPFPILQITELLTDGKAAVDLKAKQSFRLFLREGTSHALDLADKLVFIQLGQLFDYNMAQSVIKQDAAEFLIVPDEPAERTGALRPCPAVRCGDVRPQMIHVGQSLIQQSVQNLCNIAKMGVERPPADFRFPADVRYGDCVVVLISLDPQESLLDRLLRIQRPPVYFSFTRHEKSPDGRCQGHLAA